MNINRKNLELQIIDNTINSTLKINSLFQSAADGLASLTYIVTGDSTRDSWYNEMIDYYTSQLGEIGTTLYDNARSGHTGEEWKDNSDSPTLQEAIDNTSGTGETTILEYSFGINDYDGVKTKAELKAIFTEGIQAYLLAKPDVTVILCTPVVTGDTTRTTMLQEIYEEISISLGLLLIDCTIPTADVFGDSDYYRDATHPNKYGCRRVVNYILDKIIPFDLFNSCNLEPYKKLVIPSASELSNGLQSGFYWSSTNGTIKTGVDWRSLLEIAIEPKQYIDVIHQGNRTDAVFMDVSDVYIESQTASGATKTYRAPAGAAKMRINVSNEGPTYDPLGDVPSVKYQADTSNYLNIDEINDGLVVRNDKLGSFEEGIYLENKLKTKKAIVYLNDTADGFIFEEQ